MAKVSFFNKINNYLIVNAIKEILKGNFFAEYECTIIRPTSGL